MSDGLALRSARVIVTRHWWVLRRANPWSPVVEGLFEPFLYLMSIGVGIGALIGHAGTAIAGGHSYASFVAPALLAMSTMNTAANQTIWGTWYRLQFEKFYDSLVTTPLTTTDIAVGEAWAATMRGALAGICFLGVITALGMVHSLWAFAAVGAVVLIAFSFACAGLATATFMRELHHNQYVQLVMLPMFLFSATFYPLSIYPTILHDIIACLPLYQSTVLLRGLTLGQVGRDQLTAVVYLAVMGPVALWVATRRLGRLLTT